MPKITYENITFSEYKLALVAKAITIITDYNRLGYNLTLRQVYYQFVARDWFPAAWADKVTGSTNNIMSYKKLGVILGDARLRGLLDWNAMVDRTREMDGNNHWEDPAELVAAAANQFMVNKWVGQPYRPEVWVEKDALEGVVGKAAKETDVPFFSCRGYTSLTSIWANAQRLMGIAISGAVPVILHLGDHDPSGIDMSRDIEDRVRKFMGAYGHVLEFKRLALNMDQVEKYNPPENPAKSTDARYKGYVDIYGESSWELDALDPTVINDIIVTHVVEYRREAQWRRKLAEEDKGRVALKAVSRNFEDVLEFLREQGHLE